MSSSSTRDFLTNTEAWVRDRKMHTAFSFLSNQKAHLRGEVFGHAGLFDERSAGFFQTGGVVREQTRRFDLGRYVSYLMLHALGHRIMCC